MLYFVFLWNPEDHDFRNFLKSICWILSYICLKSQVVPPIKGHHEAEGEAWGQHGVFPDMEGVTQWGLVDQSIVRTFLFEPGES